MFPCCAGSMVLTTLLQGPNYFHLTAIIEQESTEAILEETAYLDTQSMNMLYSPPYHPNYDITTN